ncbi:MAG: DUF424 family protein [Methanomicrobiales archaeon]|jgi:hypothetical protein|nr:DUF424 family protein [Methanomicrobiales archaeon]
MYLKIHRMANGAEVVAVCDRDLLNTTLSAGDLEVTIWDTFYGTRLASDDEVEAALSGAQNVNLMGEKAVGIAIAMGLISEGECLMIGQVPHAQIFSM